MSKSVTVNTPEGLGKALVDKTDAIRIEGDLAKRVQHLRAITPIKWVIVFSSLSAAIASALSGVAIFVALPLAGIAIAVLGYDLTLATVSIGVAAHSPGVLKVLRKGYIEVERGLDYLVLMRD